MYTQKTLWSLNSEEALTLRVMQLQGWPSQTLRVDTTLNFVPSSPHSPHPSASFHCLLTCLPSPALEAGDLPYMRTGVISPLFPETFQCFSTFVGSLAVGIE